MSMIFRKVSEETAKNYSIVVVLAAVLVGCATSQSQKQLDEKLAQEQKVTTRSALAQNVNESLANASGLSSDQRARLGALRDTTRTKMNDLNVQSLKLRSLLVKEILAENYRDSEVSVIKKRLRKIEDQRLKTIFSAIDQANMILGRQAKSNEALLNSLMIESRVSGLR